MSGLPLGGGLFSQDSNTGSCHSDFGMPVVGGVKELDPSPEKPVTSARTPTDRKRKRKAVVSGNQPQEPPGALPPAPVDASGKGLKKINEYFSKHNSSSPVRANLLPAAGAKSPLPFSANPGLYPASPKAQFVSSPSNQGAPPSGDFATLMPSPKPLAVTACVQTDLTLQDIGSLEAQSTAELETKEGRIDELQRLNEELQRQFSKTQKELDSQKSTVNKCLQVSILGTSVVVEKTLV
jgi:hypothetical protein